MLDLLGFSGVVLPALGTIGACHRHTCISMWVLGAKLRSSCLCSKHFIISPIPGTIVSVLFWLFFFFLNKRCSWLLKSQRLDRRERDLLYRGAGETRPWLAATAQGDQEASRGKQGVAVRVTSVLPSALRFVVTCHAHQAPLLTVVK